MLNEISQAQKETLHVFCHMWNLDPAPMCEYVYIFVSYVSMSI
jgi:hypothetical protein